MDSGRGRVVPVPEDAPKVVVEARGNNLAGIFRLGDIVELRGSRFVVRDIKPNGRLALKLLTRERQADDGGPADLSNIGPGKLAFRDEGAFIVCYLSTLDGKDREEIGRMSGLLPRVLPSAWETWRAAMTAIGFAMIEAGTGAKIVGSQELPPAMLEGRGGVDD